MNTIESRELPVGFVETAQERDVAVTGQPDLGNGHLRIAGIKRMAEEQTEVIQHFVANRAVGSGRGVHRDAIPVAIGKAAAHERRGLKAGPKPNPMRELFSCARPLSIVPPNNWSLTLS